MKNKKNTSNLIFSAFLVIAYIICTFFFVGLIKSSTALSETLKSLLVTAVFVIFGLILFYATRVGDGKQIRRFSLSTLIIMDLPAIYIILASVASGLPFSTEIASCPEVVYFAGVALGYGIPYTFLSGYEIDIPEEDKDEISVKDAEKIYNEEDDNNGEASENEGTENELDELEKMVENDTLESDDIENDVNNDEE